MLNKQSNRIFQSVVSAELKEVSLLYSKHKILYWVVYFYFKKINDGPTANQH